MLTTTIIPTQVVSLTSQDRILFASTQGPVLQTDDQSARIDENAITGSFGDDRIRGTNGSDIIISLSGSDTINCEGGDDKIHLLNCPVCNSPTELIPIRTDESFRIEYNHARGMEIEFYNRPK